MAITNTTPTEVLKRFENNQKELNILDVREIHEFAQGKVPGSTNIPLGFLMQSLEKLEKGKEYVVVCRSGNRSSLACELLTNKGFNVINMDGGLMSWSGPLD